MWLIQEELIKGVSLWEVGPRPSVGIGKHAEDAMDVKTVLETEHLSMTGILQSLAARHGVAVMRSSGGPGAATVCPPFVVHSGFVTS
jgi:hypothetical protein